MRVWRWDIKNSTLITLGIVVALLIVAYAAVIPTVVAKHYLARIDNQEAVVKTKFKKVASGPSANIFENPDIQLSERQKQLDQAIKDVQDARNSLVELGRSSDLAVLPGNGFAGDYHKAVVRQERVANIILQSSQVLDQYAEILQYLSVYTKFQIKLDGYLDKVNQVSNFNPLIGRGSSMAGIADLIRSDQKLLNALEVPSDFAPLQKGASTTFSNAAAGFDKLAHGLNNGVDSQIYRAVANLESVTIKNQVNDKNLLVNLASDSTTLRQVVELKEKVEHAQGR